jgi:hypothetical protein
MSHAPAPTATIPETPEAGLDERELARIRAAAREAALRLPPMTAEQVDMAARMLRHATD